MYLIGIADSLHDRAVCLLKGDRVVCAIEEERLSRVKHGFLYDEKNYDLKKDSEHIKFLLDTSLSKDRRKENLLRCIDYCLQAEGITKEAVQEVYSSSLFETAAIEGAKEVPHHLAHAASVFFTSPFEEAAILVIDGAGDKGKRGFESTSFCYGKGRKIQVIEKIEGESRGLGELDTIITVENSLGTFYKNVSVALGMGIFGEGKTMGLAPYGEPSLHVPPLEKHLSVEKGRLWIDNLAIYHLIREYKEKYLDKARSEKEKFKYSADLAYQAQALTESILISLATHLHSLTGAKNLCVCGGVALNSVANYKILKKAPFKNMYLQPAPGDNGLSFGAAYWGYYNDLEQERTMQSGFFFSPYQGKIYQKNEILKAYLQNEKRVSCKLLEDNLLFESAALSLSRGEILGWFQEKSEIGPRALGNRSILADPRLGKNKDIVNARVKHREPFRPFAPAVLEEHVEEYFDYKGSSPYMLLIAPVKKNKKKKIPAVTHVDGTARLQTVSKKNNPRFYELISKFYQVTGVPVLLNTSFNDRGEPIVETPDEAINFFLKSDMDKLFIGNYLFTKRTSPCDA